MDTAFKIYVAITLSVTVLVGWTVYQFITKTMAILTHNLSLLLK
ncbi:MAG TPA: hypothetical protein PLR20_15645 [Syntrophales bacterium]|nr:hypothetical protein [Syntrophales bacterium]